MTHAEAKKILELVKENPNHAIEWLESKIIELEHKAGLIEVFIPQDATDKTKGSTVKAYPVSEHFCVFPGGVKDFKGFRGKLSLTHTPTGLRVAAVRGTKAEIIRAARELEELADWSPADADELNAGVTGEVRRKVLDILNSLRAY